MATVSTKTCPMAPKQVHTSSKEMRKRPSQEKPLLPSASKTSDLSKTHLRRDEVNNPCLIFIDFILRGLDPSSGHVKVLKGAKIIPSNNTEHDQEIYSQISDRINNLLSGKL